MEVCEQNAISKCVKEDGDVSFSHTKIILREGDQYYYAITSRRYTSEVEVDLRELDLVPIPVSQIWPPFPTQFGRAPEPLPQGCYVKRHSLIYYGGPGGSPEGSAELASLLLHEAGICEILRASPHPNIAQYLGCIVENDRIAGLCFVKPLVAGYSGEGIRHLHSLGLIHCDINPANIVMDGDTPVIADFDSCQRKGEKLGFKAGTPDWTNEDFEFARPENDEYGLSKIRDFLFQVRKM